MVSAAEKLPPEIETLSLSRGFQAQISRSGVQKRAFLPIIKRVVRENRLFQQNRPKAAGHFKY
jgi:hypothetical protein